MSARIARSLAILGLLLLAGCGVSAPGQDTPESIELLNASYDPTRELWRDLNAAFIQRHEADTGRRVAVRQSHGGSGAQARSVIDGLDADVVTLAMWADTNAIARAGLIAADWAERLPNGSLPYSSTIVFVVRKGNPKEIKDWPDLVREGVQVITPSPKTSGNGKLSFLAAWGSVIAAGGTEDDARNYVTRLYQNVPVLDSAARAATTTFAQKNIGDVHLTWENEAHFEVNASEGELEIVYPSVSIRAEPRVAVVDANVDRKGTRAAAEAYLNFLYTSEGQEILARHFYRPYKPEILHAHRDVFGSVELFPIQRIASGWDEAEAKFFAAGAVFDQIFESHR